jgi:hypothetical protein
MYLLKESKRGNGHHLAVTTEHGDVELINTSPRDPWEAGKYCHHYLRRRGTQSRRFPSLAPSATIINAHDEVVYDAQWRHDDKVIVRRSTMRFETQLMEEIGNMLGRHISAITRCRDADHHGGVLRAYCRG